MLTLEIAFPKAEQKIIVTARLIATNSLRQAGLANPSLLHNLQDIFVSFCQTIQQSMSDSRINFLIERKFILGFSVLDNFVLMSPYYLFLIMFVSACGGELIQNL